ncbi:FecR family protein [Methylosinus sp. RM1]|uniref:FecR family protein n=1 Tax=Methylosinus sp. RM1 TaxID=2583817 RepID=UPI0014074DF2|nr:FecR family protein [Methylosinus sp. RM1]
MPEKTAPDDRERADRIAAAIRWWVRLDAGGLSPSELAAFRAWLARDPGNEAALEEACDFWGSWQSLPKSSVRAYVASKRRPKRRRGLYSAAIFGALTAATVTIFVGDLWIWWRANVRTWTSEFRTVVLPDGSRAHLNANSALKFDYSGDRRRLVLLAGEAWFEVEKDASRPFVVEAAGGEVKALGTAFDVSINKERTEVTVTENRVEVTGEGGKVVVDAGRQTAYAPGFPACDSYEVDVERVTSWRRGKLIFKDKPLGDVLATLGRFHRGVVFMASPAIRDLRVTGVFRTDRPMEALRAIEAHLGLRALHLSDYLIVLM